MTDKNEEPEKNPSTLKVEYEVPVSTFDHSSENFFSSMDSISAVCGLPEEENFERSEIERFSSMITFLKEWKHFAYEPTAIKFAYDTGSSQVKDASDSIKLSQFSSAAVPKIDQSLDEASCLGSSDFVLHAGGLVWGLDWCPKNLEKPDSDIKCEYLAVAAHPPGSTYHKIGEPLFGRGVIQIWCLLTLQENVEFPSLRSTCKGKHRKMPVKEEPTCNLEGKGVMTGQKPRGRPRKILNVCEGDLNGSKELSPVEPIERPKKKRGRPRKWPLPTVNDLNGKPESPSTGNDLNLNECVPNLNTELSPAEPIERPKKKRGRPRKWPLPSINDLNGQPALPSTCNDLNMNEHVAYLSTDSEAVALVHVSSDLGSKGKSFVQGLRGRPRKKPIPSINKCVTTTPLEIVEDSSALLSSEESRILSENVVASFDPVEFNGKVELSVPKRRGRPRKKSTPCVEQCLQVSAIEHREGASVIPTSREPVYLTENAMVLDAADGLNDKGRSFEPMLRGNHRNEPIPSVKDVSSESVVQLGDDLSSMTIFNGLAAVSRSDMALQFADNVNRNMEPIVPKRRGRPRKKPIPSVNECVPPSSVEFVDNISNLCPSIENGVTGRCQRDIKSVVETHEDFNNRMIESKISSTARAEEQRMNDKGIEIAADNPVYPTEPTVNENELAAIAVPGICETAVTVPFQRDNEVPIEVCEGFKSDDSAMKDGYTLHSQKKRIKDKERASFFLNSSNPTLPVVSEHKEFAGTVIPSHDDHCEGGMIANEGETQKRPLIPKDIALPRVVLCLGHMGKVAWDVKWRPYSVNDTEGKHHLGYLAVLLGNGSLEVWEIPLPSMVRVLYTSCHTQGADPRFLKLEPIFKCSKVTCGDRQSIPLTVEWSPSAPHDLILVGCHDGTVGLWKFSKQHSSQDAKPLLCFSADSVPIRALAWSPDKWDTESANLIVTAGHEGLKFWDIRDPFRPLWAFNPVQRVILSLAWLKDPGCVILSFDDGSLRMLSLPKTANDTPVTGKPYGATKQSGLHTYLCSPFTIWSAQVSPTTGLVAYCNADGSTCYFQLTAKAVEKDASRHREPHFLCGSLAKEGEIYRVKTPLPDVPLATVPCPMKKLPSELGDSRSLYRCMSDKNQTKKDDKRPAAVKTTSKLGNSEKKPNSRQPLVEPSTSEGVEDGSSQNYDVFPPKDLAIHRVRWNMNKGSERWLCYGGAAGIVRCQKISLIRKQ